MHWFEVRGCQVYEPSRSTLAPPVPGTTQTPLAPSTVIASASGRHRPVGDGIGVTGVPPASDPAYGWHCCAGSCSVTDADVADAAVEALPGNSSTPALVMAARSPSGMTLMAWPLCAGRNKPVGTVIEVALPAVLTSDGLDKPRIKPRVPPLVIEEESATGTMAGWLAPPGATSSAELSWWVV